MTGIGLGELLILLALLLALTKPLGKYMADVFEGRRTILSKPLLPLERLIYRLIGVNPELEQLWTAYAASCIAFGLISFIVSFAVLRIQGWLPLNPQGFGTPGAPSGAVPLTPDLAFNIAVSFMTNTSWQPYPGEMTLSYLSQMLALGVQAFAATAAGMAAAVAMIRGFVREKSGRLGNFWVDVTRCTLYILIPLSLLAGLLLCSQGVIQNFRPYQEVVNIEGARQVIPLGPVASWESIKLLSAGDGGGFFNTNSAHPFENPTPFTSLVEMLLMLVIPAGMTYTFGRMVRDQKQGWALLAVMVILFAFGSWMIGWSEHRGTPGLNTAGLNAGGNLEGKEVRFGTGGSAVYSAAGTASSDGAVNSMHSSFTPLSGMVQLFNMLTGGVIFGGTGTGLMSMLLMVVLTVFIAGLMVGRTPEYLGKKIEAKEMKMVMLSYIATSVPLLVLTGAALIIPFHTGGYWNPPGAVTANMANHGPHGLTEILYANASAIHTNGSSFAGLNANTPWFNLTLGIEMVMGRFLVIVPALAIAGSLARKQRMALTSGTLPTHGALFVALLLGAIALVTALTFFPALSLGPIAEHYLMNQGTTFP